LPSLGTAADLGRRGNKSQTEIRRKSKTRLDHEFLLVLGLTIEVMCLFKALLLKLLLFMMPGTEAAAASVSPPSMELATCPQLLPESPLYKGETERLGGDRALPDGEVSLRREK
jgi:hypothetical protein